jgi:ankyrin repeat protein
MPWNPFKSRKDKKNRGEPIRTGFHPIDLGTFSPEDAQRDNARKEANGVGGGGQLGQLLDHATDSSLVSPARSDGSCLSTDSADAPVLPDHPKYGRDGLLSAAFTGDAKVLRLLLALGTESKLHKEDALGNTPLHLAAFAGHADAVQVLIDTPSVWHYPSEEGSGTGAGEVPPGASVHKRNAEDDTPLYMAVLCNNLEIVTMLADACGRQVNLSNVEGFSPLHYAAGEGSLPVTRFLVEECGADCKARDKLGLTPAFCAVLQGRVQVAEYLLVCCSACIEIPNSGGDTMLHCAIRFSVWRSTSHVSGLGLRFRVCPLRVSGVGVRG